MFICCDNMRFYLKTDKNVIEYRADTRSYKIILYKSDYGHYQSIEYCPWCGIKLPKSLLEEQDEILRKEYGVKDFFKDKHKIPKEFNSDKWWKKRGL